MNKTVTPAVPAAVAALRCRCCGGVLEVIYQMGLLPHHSGMWLVTCPNEGLCVLGKQTFEASKYPTKDLSPYFSKRLLTAGQPTNDTRIPS